MKRVMSVVVAIVLCVAVAPVAAQTFSRVEMHPGLGTMDHILAVADLNGDGLDDLLLGDKFHSEPHFTAADRLRKVPLRIFISHGDGTFTYAPRLVEGDVMAHHAVVVTDDFNTDGKTDLAVFDQGAYESALSLGFGNPPQLFVSCPDGVLRPLNSLELAVRDLARDAPGRAYAPRRTRRSALEVRDVRRYQRRRRPGHLGGEQRGCQP